LSGDYEPDEFEDDYAEAVTALVATKIEGGEITETPEAKSDDTEVIDLLAALQRSVDKAKAAKGSRADSAGPGPASESASGDGAKTTKKAAAKKTTTKKSTAKKAAAKKSA
ncbi:MAG: Ku protein, partial [Terracoccus sp.]